MGCPQTSHGGRLDVSNDEHTSSGVRWAAIVATLHPVTDAAGERSAPQDPLPPELLAPAFGVPMTTVVGGAGGHDDEMAKAGPDDVVASRAAVLLVAHDLPNL